MCALEMQPTGARGNAEEFPRALVTLLPFCPALRHPKVMLRIPGGVREDLVTVASGRDARQIFTVHFCRPSPGPW